LNLTVSPTLAVTELGENKKPSAPTAIVIVAGPDEVAEVDATVDDGESVVEGAADENDVLIDVWAAVVPTARATTKPSAVDVDGNISSF
jgi:hypothetical protein